jgi:inositol hexakisphosphate/diphosphoinositol-pentakisphosphate kinase
LILFFSKYFIILGKSPALDGVVERDEHGKEIRYPVMLRAEEKIIAKKVVLAFKQNVCGFDLLRAYGKSYVCDVNGFSFVKNSTKYYDDCASILADMVIKILAPERHIPLALSYEAESRPIVPTSYGTMMELRCVIAVMRHGDRTPKQKMKMEVKHKLFFNLFEKYDGMKTGNLKLKKPSQLQEVLDVARALLIECNKLNVENLETKETRTKLLQLKSVLEMYGHFSGINRKVQFKYQQHGNMKNSSSDEDLQQDVFDSPSLLLILKWGGELTDYGIAQAEDLGTAFRKLYPGEGTYSKTNKSDRGFLRLHSTYRHDLKIYASDEGRVQTTAAAFAKGLLALEGELAPILVQMVKSANTNGLLDNDSVSDEYQNLVKAKLRDYISIDKDFTEYDFCKLAPTRNYSLISALQFIKNPLEMCKKVYVYIKELTNLIRNKITESKCYEIKLYHSETWELMLRRWSKLEKDFYNKKKEKFEISKIPDIYDSIKYDLMHNKNILNFEHAMELYTCSKALADYVIPQEYGITEEEKLRIAQGIIAPLLQKIRIDLKSNLTGIWSQEDDSVNKLNPSYSKGIQTPGRHVRTRLYFTSESHIYSLFNILRYGRLLETDDDQWIRAKEYMNAVPELNYLTQIVIMLYEDTSVDPESDKRFHIELHFSPGACDCLDEPSVNRVKTNISNQPFEPLETLNNNLGLEAMNKFFHSIILQSFEDNATDCAFF